MADFSIAAPDEPEKADFLHDRTTRPAAPSERRDLAHLALLIVVGAALGAAMLALAYQARASWTEARDWVVPMTVPFYALGGVALAYLLLRRAWLEASVGLTLVGLVLVATAFNLWRAALTSGDDGLRDALTIIASISLGLAIAALIAGMAWVEVRRPAAPPPPER